MNSVTLYISTHNVTGLKYFDKTTRYFTIEELQKYYHGSGKYWNNHLNKHGNNMYGKTHSEETRNKISNKLKGKQAHNKNQKDQIVKCPHCEKLGGNSVMKRWHFDNCKHKGEING